MKGQRNGNWKKLARMLFIVLAYRRAKRSEGRKNCACERGEYTDQFKVNRKLLYSRCRLI